jgi:hemolysin D
VGWATVAKIEEFETAPGKLVTTSPRIIVQPLETSVIRAIAVSAGDVVKNGQELATLDPTFSQSDVEQIRTRLSASNAQIARLEAELAGSEYEASALANPDEILQSRLFLQRKAFYQSSLRNFDEQMARDQSTLESTRAEEQSATGRLEALSELEAMRATLLASQNGSRVNLLLSRESRLDVEGNLTRVRGKQVELMHAIETTRSERQAFIEEFRRNALELLVETRSKHTAANEELKKAELRRNMVVLTAPSDAVVLDIAQRSIGSVVREAETLFTLVPLNVPLEAEVLVEGKDVGQIADGRSVGPDGSARSAGGPHLPAAGHAERSANWRHGAGTLKVCTGELLAFSGIGSRRHRRRYRGALRLRPVWRLATARLHGAQCRSSRHGAQRRS